jgi:poly-gamma-glutamate capsule biosynthesis protein CapA/YwtB (metallophosphatase superfamily)
MERRRALLVGLGHALALLTALATPSHVSAYGFDDAEQAYQDAYLATPISLQGRIVDELGLPVDGAQLRLIGWGEGEINDGEATTSWFGGSFSLPELARRNALLEVSLTGYYTEIIPVQLQRPLDEDSLELPDIELVERRVGRVRLSFAGDAMFGRRMFERGVLEHDTLAQDTEALFRYVEPTLWADDHTAINLETPVTDHLWTPHPKKSFVFNAYPQSAAVLPSVGIDSVSLGNNHVYDFLMLGLLDTLDHLDEIGLAHYGAGLNGSHAAASVYRPTINGVELSLQGFSDISGNSHGLDALKLVALDVPSKPGALHSSATRLDAFIDEELDNGRLAIPIIHGGIEYTTAQSEELRADLERSVERGAALVIAHHPHVVHGVQQLDAGAGPRFVFGSLGNLVFDQEVFETLRSYIAVVDISEVGDSFEVDRVRLVPIVLDDYAPRLLVGDAVAKLGRHVAQLSVDEAAESGFAPALVFAEGGRLVVAADESELAITDLIDTRELPLHDGATGPIALEPFTPTDALAAVASDTPSKCQLGRDLLGIGDFEDPDVDASYQEGDLWSQSNHRYLQGIEVHDGSAAAVLLRRSKHDQPTTLRMTRRIAVAAGRSVTIHGWHAARNAGLIVVSVRWRNREGEAIAYDDEYAKLDGTFSWSSFAIDVKVPAAAASLEVEFHLHPPAAGEGRLLLDDLAFIEWSAPLAVEHDPLALASPNAWDFVRCELAGPKPKKIRKSLQLTLTHRVYATKLNE